MAPSQLQSPRGSKNVDTASRAHKNGQSPQKQRESQGMLTCIHLEYFTFHDFQLLCSIIATMGQLRDLPQFITLPHCMAHLCHN